MCKICIWVSPFALQAVNLINLHFVKVRAFEHAQNLTKSITVRTKITEG